MPYVHGGGSGVARLDHQNDGTPTHTNLAAKFGNPASIANGCVGTYNDSVNGTNYVVMVVSGRFYLSPTLSKVSAAGTLTTVGSVTIDTGASLGYGTVEWVDDGLGNMISIASAPSTTSARIITVAQNTHTATSAVSGGFTLPIVTGYAPQGGGIKDKQLYMGIPIIE